MGYLLPSRGYFRVFDTNEVVDLAGVSLTRNTELHAIRLLFYKHGTPGGSERFRLKLYRDADRQTLAYTSSYTSLASVTDLGDKWFGWVSVSFARESLPASTTFYPTLEIENYTRNADTYYLACSLDWPNPQYGVDNTTRRSLAIQIYGYEDVT